jgi:hypothetical protein
LPHTLRPTFFSQNSGILGGSGSSRGHETITPCTGHRYWSLSTACRSHVIVGELPGLRSARIGRHQEPLVRPAAPVPAPSESSRTLSGMGKQKQPGDASTPKGAPGGPPGKKQRRKARKARKGGGKGA